MSNRNIFALAIITIISIATSALFFFSSNIKEFFGQSRTISISSNELSRLVSDGSKNELTCTIFPVNYFEEDEVYVFFSKGNDQNTKKYVVWGKKENCSLKLYIDPETIQIMKERGAVTEAAQNTIKQLVGFAIVSIVGEDNFNVCQTCTYSLINLN